MNKLRFSITDAHIDIGVAARTANPVALALTEQWPLGGGVWEVNPASIRPVGSKRHAKLPRAVLRWQGAWAAWKRGRGPRPEPLVFEMPEEAMERVSE